MAGIRFSDFTRLGGAFSAFRPARYRRRLAAVLCADAKGYSRLMGTDEETTQLAVDDVIEQFRSKAKEHSGRIVNVAGDGLTAEFESAQAALTFALTVQKAIGLINQDKHADQRVAFRIGIHLGDVLVGRGDIFGETVNIAARLEKLAPPGGICVSGAIYEQVKSRVVADYHYMGLQWLKNIKHPLDVYRIPPEAQSGFLLPRRRELESVAGLAYPPLPSVIVLPFTNVTRDPAEDYLVDGVTEDLTNSLSRFRELFVISHHSAAMYKGHQTAAQRIARDLGVRYIVDGSVRRRGHRIRLGVNLTDALRAKHLWGEQYDRPLDDIFAIQDELTETVVAALAVRISEEEHRRSLQAETESLEAYGLILRGQQLIFRHEREANARARSFYEQALLQDDSYARAYAALSRTYSWADDGEIRLDKAMELALAAVGHDEFEPRAHAELGFVHLYKRMHDASISAYQRAYRLNPNDADLLAEMADALMHCGQPEDAVQLLHRAMRLNPYYPDWYLWYLGAAHYQACDYQNAIEAISRMKNPAEGRRVLAASYAMLGRRPEATRQAEEVLRVHPNFSLDHWAEVQPDRNRADTEHFIEGLRRAGLK